MIRDAIVITCDEPGCGDVLRMPVRPGHWLGQPWQEAINIGWDVDKDKGPDFCPAHHSWLPRVPWPGIIQ